MAQASESPRPTPLWTAFLRERRGLLRDYLAAISGAGGRLVFSLAYFVALANTLSLEDFGLFATASAAGVMLSRLLAFGFISALYRTATVRPRLLGVYSAGFLALAAASLPAIGVAAFVVHLLFFGSSLSLGILAMVVAAEALLWRPVEVAIIVNNGLGRFGRGAFLTIIGTVLRAAFAVGLMAMPTATLSLWAEFYIAANAMSFAIAFGFSTRGKSFGWRPGFTGAGCRTRSMWPAPKCCSTCRWSSTSSSCWASAEPSSPGFTPSSCGWST